MAWLGEGLSSLSSLKGQITNFTKEVLSDGIVNEIDGDLEDANAKCNQLQELLNSKEAEISILRKQNSELQKAVVEFHAKPNDSKNNGSQDDDGGGFFWDPPSSRSREAKVQNQTKLLQDQLDQATVKIRDMESELNRLRMLNSSNVKDDANIKEEGPSQKTELLRAKQDVMNRIIQMGEKSREVERNTKHLQKDEQTLVNDFRTAISKLASPEQYDLIRSALLALENETEHTKSMTEKEKSDSECFDNEGNKARNKANDREMELRQRIKELEIENQTLSSSIEELDKQNAESIESVLSLKEELQKKHHSLQSAYEHLYVEYNESLATIENLKHQVKVKAPQQVHKETVELSVQTIIQPKEDKETEIRVSKEDKETEIRISKEDKETEAFIFEEILILKEDKETETDTKDNEQLDSQIEIEKVKDILKNAPLESFDNKDSVFINLARQFVELKWKKETLERKLNDQSRELKETKDLRDSLQIDCEDMQTNIESLHMEIQRLKSNLPSIPEASEERVASLETETESLQEEIRMLRKTNSEMSSELKAIKTAIKEAGANIDLARIETLLGNKSKHKQPQDLGEQLQLTLDENTALRRRIDVLESELRVSLERCKGLDENIELIEELKLDLETARRELKIALSNNKRLENAYSILQDAKNDVDAENEVLVREKEQIESDLKLLRESDTNAKDGEALGELHEELKKARDEKNDLDYDIRNMRNELDNTIEELENSREEIDRLKVDNERLVKEANKVLDQFNETQNESLDKIDLLNTEVTLLQQELDGSKEESESTAKKLKEAEDKILTLENINREMKAEIERMNDVHDENQRLKNEIEEMMQQTNANQSKEEMNVTLTKLEELEEKLSVFERENERLKNELIRTENVDRENRRLIKQLQEKQNEISKDEDDIANVMTKLKVAENYMGSLEDENRILESKLSEMQNLQEECERTKKEIEELRQQQEIERSTKEAEIDAQKKLITQYQNDLDNLKTLEVENQNLKMELDKLLVDKRDVEVNSSIAVSSENNLDKAFIFEQLVKKSEEIEALEAKIAKDKESALMARETVENLSQLISTKDNELIKVNASFDALKNERDELIKLVQEKHNESLQYHSEIQRLTQLINEQNVNLQKVIAEKDANAAVLHDKESQLLWSQNELQVIKQRLQNVEQTNNYAEHCSIAEHTLLTKQVSTLEEKNKAMEAAIIQDQSTIRYLQEQLTETQNKESNALKEVERLRNHLVEIESSHMEEALQSEEIHRTLEARLIQAEEKLKNSSTIYTSANVRANQQVETLQQQLTLIVQQRDDLQNKLSAAEDKVLSYTASLTNLQLVLEQFQRDKEKDIQAATAKLRNQLQDSSKKEFELTKEISHLNDQLTEAKECLLAASRLTEQLDQKSERIEQLEQEVNRLTGLVETADQRIQEAFKSGEGKVDRSLIKNLLLGYISSPPNDKTSVLRVFANILDFNETEREKTGLNSSHAKNSWFSSVINSSPTSSKEQEASLSSAFVKFLENESQPKPQLPALPISNSPISRPGHSRQHSSSSTQSTLLLSNVNLPTFPEFVPARNTGSILKEVLKDS